MPVRQQQTPAPAEISYCVAVIPSNAMKSSVATASMAITRSFENDNIIDNVRFPAHISLYLGGTVRDQVPLLVDEIRKAIQSHLSEKLRATRLYSGHGGFIGVEIEDDNNVKALFEAVMGACARVHQAKPYVRPHLISRWPRMRQDQRELIEQLGTYKTDASDLHISVAQVDAQDLDAAFVVAQKHFSFPAEFGIDSLQIVDVGHNNEKWTVLWSSGA